MAREADVDVIVTGTVLRAGGEIRVTTQLADASTGALLWSNTAQAPVGDVFRLQDELTQRIVASLALPLTAREQRMLKHDVPANAAAYDYFLRGNQLSYDSRQWSVARELYLRCVEEDPRFAPAWARLGRMHLVMGKYLRDRHAREPGAGRNGLSAGAGIESGSPDGAQAAGAARCRSRPGARCDDAVDCSAGRARTPTFWPGS